MFRKNRSSDVYFATITGNAMRCDAMRFIRLSMGIRQLDLTLSLPCTLSVQIKRKNCKNVNSVKQQLEHRLSSVGRASPRYRGGHGFESR